MIVGILFFAVAAIFCHCSVVTLPKTSSLVQQFLAFVLFAIGTVATNCGPYALLLGTAIVFLSFLRFWNKEFSKTLLKVGCTSFLAALLVTVVSLFQSPTNDDTEIEDRTDWKPPVAVEKTPQELLALDWSTYDQNCDWPVAKLMLELCGIAYDAPVDAKDRITKLGFESESINAGSMQGYVIDAGDDSLIVLRGTEKHEYDLLQDLRFLKARTEQGAMHGGFVNGYTPMHDQVVKLLERYDTKRVWITGHSLGGGLAVVCSHQLLVDYKYPIAGVMTFGQPKVVLQDMATYLGPRLDGKYVFFVNDMDPVTRLINPYQHFGHMVRWTDNDIERSKRVAKSGASSDQFAEPSINTEVGYVEDMSDAELNELIQMSEDAKTPKYDESGKPLLQGIVPNGYDHFLSSYEFMLEKLHSHTAKK